MHIILKYFLDYLQFCICIITVGPVPMVFGHVRSGYMANFPVGSACVAGAGF